MAKINNSRISMKHIGVDKANARIVLVTSLAAFLSIFFIVGAVSLLGQLRYQNRIIAAKKTAINQLKKNLTARDSLVKSYSSFATAPTNFLGGNSSGSGPQDGNNPKLVLDALPDKYDFPALTSSLEKVAGDDQLIIQTVTGSDDSVAQETNVTNAPVAMPFEIKASGTYDNVQKLVNDFDKSIRPIQFQKLSITNDPLGASVDVTGSSYYQPQKTITIKSKDVK